MANAKTFQGNVPDQSPVALLLIDVINDLDFPEGQALLRQAMPMAKRLASLLRRARRHGIAAVYVNDNFGRWRSDFRSQVMHCLQGEVLGKPVATLLRPNDEDYFVLKPAHSGFYATALDLLLKQLGAQTLIITGLATNICVLFTANDAYQRGYQVVIPADCVAANTAKLSRDAVRQMERDLKAEIVDSRDRAMRKWIASTVKKSALRG